MGSIATVSPHLDPRLRERAEAHYRDAAGLAPEVDRALLSARSKRQVSAALAFIPRYYGWAAFELTVLAALVLVARPRPLVACCLPPFLFGLVLLDLALFGYGLNPAIAPEVQRLEPPVIAGLRNGLKPGERALGIGQELPPNVLMRFGLADLRNYDSVELARSLKWFEPLYEPQRGALTSRSQITWERVLRGRERLEEATVAAVVGDTPPPAGAFRALERAGDVWIAWLDPAPWISAEEGVVLGSVRRDAGRLEIHRAGLAAGKIVIRETWDPGWKAWIDGQRAPVGADRETFLSVEIQSGDHTVVLKYQPDDVIMGLAGSVLGLVLVILGLTGWPRF
jgi:hypothetical protein